MTAQQILESKGYDNEDCIEIIAADDNSLDIQVRKYYKVEGEPLHLWEAYYIGDANEEEIEKIAKKHNCDTIEGLFSEMDDMLLNLASNYPTKS